MWHGQKAFDSLRFQTGHTVDHVTTRRHSLHRGKCCLWDATPSREERTPGGGCKGCRTSSSLSLVVSHRSLCQYLATANFESPLFTGLLLNSVRRETGTPGKYAKHRMKARRCSKIAGTSQRTLQTACDSTEPPGLKIFGTQFSCSLWKLELATLQGLASKCTLLSIIERPHNHRTKRSMSKLRETWCGKKININKYMLSSKSSTVFHGHTRKFNEDSNNTSISWINDNVL